MRGQVARIVQTVARLALFFAVWVAVTTVPMMLWEKPGSIAHSPAWLRVYWELVTLVATIVVTWAFIVFVDKRRFQVTMTRRPVADSLLGVGLGIVWLGLVAVVLWGTGFLSITGSRTPHLFGVYVVALFINTWAQELLVHGYLFSYLRHKHTTRCPRSVGGAAILPTGVRLESLGPW